MSVQVAHRGAAGAAEPSSSRAWLGWLLQILCLVYAAFVIVEDVEQCLWDWPTDLAARGGSLGALWASPGDGFVVVKSLAPDGAMARAGVATGDRVRFDRPSDRIRHLRAGEDVGFTLVHMGRTSHLHAVAQPRKPHALTSLDRVQVFFDPMCVLDALLGAFIIWRGGRRPTTLLLGSAIVAFGLTYPTPQLWFSAPTVAPFAYVLGMLPIAGEAILFYAFARSFHRDCLGPAKPFEGAAFWLIALVAAFADAVAVASPFNAIVFPVVGDGVALAHVVSYLGFALCLTNLALGWRKSAAAVRRRYALMLLATSALIVSQALYFALEGLPRENVALVLFTAILGGVVAPALFAYSILRHKVLDLGFAVNRTLVYAVVSAILLAAFGLIEWAVDHLVPIEGREKNALVDAAVAVGVFLTFHRVRDVVEQGVEGLFFRRWQKAEVALRRFVKEAAFVSQPQALSRAFTRALADYGEGAGVAVYLAEAAGEGYTRAEGEVAGVPARLDRDLPPLVSLRADPKPADLHDNALGAALIAPMVNRNEVTGFVLLGPKPSDKGYRPDEIELIGWATRQVGLDLHALKVEQLESAAARHKEEIATLRSLIPQRA